MVLKYASLLSPSSPAIGEILGRAAWRHPHHQPAQPESAAEPDTESTGQLPLHLLGQLGLAPSAGTGHAAQVRVA